MVKTIFMALLGILGGVLVAYIVENYDKEDVDVVQKDYQLHQLPCSLNLQSCDVTYKSEIINFDINPKPVRFMEKTTIHISGLKGKYKDLNIRIYGLNMNMGVIKAGLNKIDENNYEAIISLSSCLLTTMRYRAEVFDGEKSIGLFVDFDLRRS